MIADGLYKGAPKKVLSGESLSVTLLPSHGGKIQSILYHGKEYLHQNDCPAFIKSA